MGEDEFPSSVFEFPCSFPLRVFGKVADDFEDVVLSIVSKHIETLETGTVSSRESSGGKYVCVTVTFEARSKDQLDALYMELTDHERVLMLL
jgi:peptide-methionine (S)-S-oxide reductase